jgi:hypothetical protein
LFQTSFSLTFVVGESTKRDYFVIFNALPIAASAANKAVANTIAEITVNSDSVIPSSPKAFHPHHETIAEGTAQQRMAMTDRMYDFMGEGKWV